VYLKSIELIGFKSFADRIPLQFEPGMTAIVGPNGCGKSNVADAVRWVLGETSAKALRGNKMEDCIFAGTDNRKQLGMAEVSITFADCEKILGLDYNEVTLTRRVFRSGEGQYFMNKVPCRLKDIQRLFMNTGIGTSSYSLMEQGRIDQILSSRPEDRREIFEEASGITRFKADKKEALHKLEQTEANLLRLSDVIREVKRQIGSLQRQAGKARRYKELRDELRTLDLWAGRLKLNLMDQDLRDLEQELTRSSSQVQALHEAVAKLESQAEILRTRMRSSDQAIEQAMEHKSEAQTRLDRTTDRIRLNEERARQLSDLTARDTRDIEEARGQIQKFRRALDETTTAIEEAGIQRDQTEREWHTRQGSLQAIEQEIEQRRQQQQALRNESLHLESESARLHNEMVLIENRERATMTRKERLIAEKSQLSATVKNYEKRQSEMTSTLRLIGDEVEKSAAQLDDVNGQKSRLVESNSHLQTEFSLTQAAIAAKRAQIDMLGADETRADDFPGGARLLLDPAKPLGQAHAGVLGALAQRIEVPAEYRTALEAVLRSWFDAILVRSVGDARAVIRMLAQRHQGAARLLALASPDDMSSLLPADGPGQPFIALVTCDDELRPLMRRLLANVRVVPSMDGIDSVPPDQTYVTVDGMVLRGNGACEFWMADARPDNPLTRRHMHVTLQEELVTLERTVSDQHRRRESLTTEIATLEDAVEQSRSTLEERRRALAVEDGKNREVSQEANQARDRLETVAWELHNLEEEGDGTAERQSISTRIDGMRDSQATARVQMENTAREIQELEPRRATLYNDVGESRVRFAEARQRTEHLEAQRDPLKLRITESEHLIAEREAGIRGHAQTIDELEKGANEARNQLSDLQAAVDRNTTQLDTLRRDQGRIAAELDQQNAAIGQQRNAFETLTGQRTGLEVRYAESRMRRTNLIDRCTTEYAVTLEEIVAHPEPEWPAETGQPTNEAMEQAIADLRARIDAMGPVNLVAIEEYQELEERHTFLTNQQDDLTKAKEQLLEMIKKINATTSEMFMNTFAAVNENFQTMFRQLFNGGTAKLVLVDTGDVLESGIDIIARPPGMKLQTVSLLSGGQRTMTAVALLFSIYMIKPSPFCILDELDAALDESNILRFVKVLEGFLAQSQFIVITHNRKTIAAANVLYGVTMEESGISKVVSLRFSEYETNPRLKAAESRL